MISPLAKPEVPKRQGLYLLNQTTALSSMDNLNVTLDSLSPALFKLFSPTSDEKTVLKVITNSEKSKLSNSSRNSSKKRKN
jgi:hypothetical protein